MYISLTACVCRWINYCFTLNTFVATSSSHVPARFLPYHFPWPREQASIRTSFAIVEPRGFMGARKMNFIHVCLFPTEITMRRVLFRTRSERMALLLENNGFILTFSPLPFSFLLLFINPSNLDWLHRVQDGDTHTYIRYARDLWGQHDQIVSFLPLTYKKPIRISA